jgi:hypothetical protein
MMRRTFITATSIIALVVGLLALALPSAVLAAKGVAPSPAAGIWVREVGALLIALGTMGLLVRSEPDSRALRAFLVCSAIVHLGLFPIEIAAYLQGIITRLDGIAPNTALHAVVACGCLHFARSMRVPPPERGA